MAQSLKNKIIELRKQDKTYFEICTLLKCSKSTVSYHCKSENLITCSRTPQKISVELIDLVNQYYSNHTAKDTALKFNISISTVKRCSVLNKRKYLTAEERKINNYNRVKTHRQKLKQKAVDYLGGKCLFCDYSKSVWSMHFHHKNSVDKSFTISEYQNLSWNTIRKELDKCMLICANCHGEVHEKEYNLGAHVPMARRC